ncbi:CubicO group peptidase, beta-lactamase class C family [Butyrivibrio sp. ob235]|uniref:serine hydrolase domain-containing protein n=1 Tax=Butyrivibrio sp. ob235 TaxID=1761780 RepID=UPI0008CBE3E5|nr:serine hydrolase domain-containing protein [Butyrivibrio sp. ob235]SEL61810.1 CubicO group peptidase, beta-lactamase class C family [Butyrivibrio sp. ob235]
MRDKKKLFTECIDRIIDSGELVGLNALVLKDGEEKMYAEAGFADLEAKKPFKRDTIVRLYSQSKPITAAAAMLLIQDGIIEPYEPVGNYIESFKNQEIVEGGVRRPVRWDRPMFIKDLLDMTSGLVYPFDNTAAEITTGQLYNELIDRLPTDNMMSTMEFAERLGRLPLEFQPGDHFRYGTSADVLGAVIETASGMKFGDFLKERIFEPLNMKDTGFYVPEEKMDRFATAYDCYGEAPVRYSGNNLGIRDDGKKNAFESGGAGIFSTIDDYANFARMLMNGGIFEGKEILTKNTVRFMTGAQLTDEQQNDMKTWSALGGFSYGNLMRIMKNPGRAGIIAGEGEYGWDGWLGPYFCNDPESGTTFLMLTQRVDYGTGVATRKLRNIIFS